MGDEHALLLDESYSHDRHDDRSEVISLKRFVQSVKENPWSSNWQGVSGEIRQWSVTGPVPTGRSSLPL